MDEYEIIEKNRTEKINIIFILSDSFVKKFTLTKRENNTA
tara:strand:+ start:282 stop:401 length:120 start_codon:yes stop_codon:yes gene_type:complete